jgi:ABC-type transporter Mla maintaining outer membrane lipid asymmetry permease subunit MlaE
MSQRKNLRQLLAMTTLAVAGTAGAAATAAPGMHHQRQGQPSERKSG